MLKIKEKEKKRINKQVFATRWTLLIITRVYLLVGDRNAVFVFIFSTIKNFTRQHSRIIEFGIRNNCCGETAKEMLASSLRAERGKVLQLNYIEGRASVTGLIMDGRFD